jgi:hypothetical protein
MDHITLEQAEVYMATRLGASSVWSTGVDKEAALQTAENMLAVKFDLENADAVQETVRASICEQALFLLRDPDGIEARQSLQAQGVTSAGILRETYAGGSSLPVCAFAQDALAPLALGGAGGGPFHWVR